MESRKIKPIFAKQTCIPKGEGGWTGRLGLTLYTTMYKIDTPENLFCSTGNSVLWGDLNGKEIQTRGYIYMCVCTYTRVTDSYCCIAETNKTV